MRPTTEQLAEWRAKTAATTPGRWTLDRRREGKRNGIQRIVINDDICEPVSINDDYGENNLANTEFAAMAHVAMPALLDEVEMLRAKYESTCKCGNRKAEMYDQCEDCYVAGG